MGTSVGQELHTLHRIGRLFRYKLFSITSSEEIAAAVPRPNLIVRGLEVDTVDCISEMMPERDLLTSEHWRIQDLWTKITASLESYPHRSDLATAFFWTLTAGKN